MRDEDEAGRRPRCPRCGGSKVVESSAPPVWVNEWEVLHPTHRCANEECSIVFRFEPPEVRR